jgi:Fur family transcriptional regulator, ferric uptake regulator
LLQLGCIFDNESKMMKNENQKDALLTLQEAGIAKTSQRLAVLNILLAATMPLSANAIRQNLQTQASIDKVTVYRILSLFKQHRMIREIASAGGANYFEMATLENPLHPHFSCRNCGVLTCLAPLPFSQAPELFLSKDDYSIDHVEINISGLCACCRNTIERQ